MYRRGQNTDPANVTDAKRSSVGAKRVVHPLQPATPAQAVAEDGEEATLAVLEDAETGTEFYMEILDQFDLEGRTYVAMFPMQQKRSQRKPELVFLRRIAGDGRPGQTQYESIRNRRELELVFNAFFTRYEQSLR